MSTISLNPMRLANTIVRNAHQLGTEYETWSVLIDAQPNEDTPPGKNRIIANKDQGKGPGGWQIEQIENRVAAYIRGSDKKAIWVGVKEGQGDLRAGVMHDIWLVNAGPVATLHVDGVMVAEVHDEKLVGLQQNTDPIEIGGRTGTEHASFAGWVARTMVRQGPLSNADIAALQRPMSLDSAAPPEPEPGPEPPRPPYTTFPFVQKRLPTVSHAGVESRPPFNAADPWAARKTDPMSGLEFCRISGDHGTPVVLRGTEDSGLRWAKVTKSENAPSCFRGFNADGSVLLLCESKQVSGDPSNACRFALIDCTGEHGATRPFQVIRASGKAYGGDIEDYGPGSFWDPLDRYSMYSSQPNGMYRWWPFGRPASGGEPSRKVGETVKLYDWPIAGCTKMERPRGGRARPSADGKWYFVPCKDSAGKWGGFRLELATGKAGGPFVRNPDAPNDDDDRAIAKTSSMGRYGHFTWQDLGQGRDTTNLRFYDMETGEKVGQGNNLGGGHADYVNIDGVEYLTGWRGGNWRKVNPIGGVVTNIAADPSNGVEHSNANNYFDLFERCGACGGSEKGIRYLIGSVSSPSNRAGIFGLRLGCEDVDPDAMFRYLVNHRSSYSNNYNEVHPHIAPRFNSLGELLLYFNSDWRMPGRETDSNHVNSYIVKIPDAWHSTDNSGLA